MSVRSSAARIAVAAVLIIVSPVAAHAASYVTFDVSVTACEATASLSCDGFTPFRFSQTYRFGELELRGEFGEDAGLVRLLSASGSANREPGADATAGSLGLGDTPVDASLAVSRTMSAMNNAVGFGQTATLTEGDTATSFFSGLGFQGVEVDFGTSDDDFVTSVLQAGRTFQYDAGFNQRTDPDGPDEVVVLSRTTTGTATISAFRIGAAPVPEPATWLMMLLGFGATAMVLRHRGPATAPATGRA